MGPGNGNPLLLPPGQLGAATSDQGVVTQRQDEVVNVGFLCAECRKRRADESNTLFDAETMKIKPCLLIMFSSNGIPQIKIV